MNEDVQGSHANTPVKHDDFNVTEPTRVEGPRVWNCFVTVAAVFAISFVAQIVAVVGLVFVLMANGVDANDIQRVLNEELLQPFSFIALGLVAQMPILFGAVVAARLSPESIPERLRLKGTGLPAWSYVSFALASIVPVAVGLVAAQVLTLIIPPDESALQLWNNITATSLLPYLLFISLVPGFGEEFLFRGYFQSRLLKRIHPWLAILITSLIFGAFHILPHSVAFATTVGIWLGYLAWRTDSIWPCIVCHAFINGAWTLFNLAVINCEWDDATKYSVMAGLVIVGLIALFPSLLLLQKATPSRENYESAKAETN